MAGLLSIFSPKKPNDLGLKVANFFSPFIKGAERVKTAVTKNPSSFFLPSNLPLNIDKKPASETIYRRATATLQSLNKPPAEKPKGIINKATGFLGNLGLETTVNPVLRATQYLTKPAKFQQEARRGPLEAAGAAGDVASLFPLMGVGKSVVKTGATEANNLAKYLPTAFKSAKESEAAKYVLENLGKMKQDYFTRIMGRFGAENIISADEAKAVIPGFKGINAPEVHEASSAFSKNLYDQRIATQKGAKNNTVMFMSGGTGAGKTSAIQSAGIKLNDFPIVYDTNLSGFKTAAEKIQQAIDNGYRVEINYVQRHPVTSFTEGVLPRVKKEGRIVTIGEHIERHDQAIKTLEQLKQKFGDQINVRYIDNTGPKDSQSIVSFDNLPKFNYNKGELQTTLNEKLNDAVQKGQVTTEEANAIRAGGSVEARGRNSADVGGRTETAISQGSGGGFETSGRNSASFSGRAQSVAGATTGPGQIDKSGFTKAGDLLNLGGTPPGPRKPASINTIFPRKPQELNVNRLDLNTKGKAHVADLDSTEIRQKLGDKQVIQIAKDAGIDTKTYSIDQTAKKIAEQLNQRRNVVSLENEFQAASDVSKKEDIAKQIAESARSARTQGTDIARQLSARRIIANELDTPMQRIFKLLDNAGVNPDVYAKEAAKVDFANGKDVVDFYRKFVPAKFGDWINEIRYNSMLSSPLTHIVNVFSNAVNTTAVAPVEKAIAGAVDFFASKATGKARTAYVGESGAYAKGYAQSVGTAIDKLVAVLQGKSAMTNLDLRFAPAATKGVKGAISKTLRVPSTALEAMDQFFMALTTGGEKAALEYKASKGGKIPGLGTGDIATQAADNAAYRVYRQEVGKAGQGSLLNAIDFIPKKIMEARSSNNPIVQTIGRFTFPFIGTPTNIAKQGVEYSPAGLLTTFGAKNKTEQVSKAILGTAATMGASTLLSSGRLTWAEPTDAKKKAAFRAGGLQPYSVKIGDKWFSYAKLPPAVGFNLAFISALDSAMKDKKINGSWVDAATGAAAKYGNFLADQSYFKQMGDLLASVKGDPESFSRYVANYPQQLIPMRAFGGWLARMTDQYQRKVNPDANFVDSQVQNLMLNIPGLSKKLSPRTDLLGNPIKNQYPIGNALSPIRVSKEDVDNLIQINESEGGLSLYTGLKGMSKEKANAYVNNLEDRRPEIVAKLRKFKEIESAGLHDPELAMYGTGIKDGERAGLITTQLNKLPTKADKNAYIDKLTAVGIFNDEVHDQLINLKSSGKLLAPTQ